ncbi:copper chaperone PCu(A)C [Aliifodinibius salicampi]|uniref:Copper chaperone PCu(A)C n=1 Tax=Fodinibius salicampi TaxID=1920655 RepID=A0ABT3Q250_9BACT|nr:copper chaperone PCu(A)C [Fodinibius salicampi]MCW9714190.1 copper chaperone PCu(A)C [Fodinibius salicampi]
MNSSRLILLTGLVIVGICACTSNESKEGQHEGVIFGKIELSDGWVRPATKGGMSAAYLTISNGTVSRDTLMNISSSAAAKAELHESYKGENGIMAMRPVSQPVIPSGEKLHMSPGRFHIMLQDLNRNLSVGDSVDITLTYSRVDTQSIRLPVKSQP